MSVQILWSGPLAPQWLRPWFPLEPISATYCSAPVIFFHTAPLIQFSTRSAPLRSIFCSNPAPLTCSVQEDFTALQISLTSQCYFRLVCIETFYKIQFLHRRWQRTKITFRHSIKRTCERCLIDSCYFRLYTQITQNNTIIKMFILFTTDFSVIYFFHSSGMRGYYYYYYYYFDPGTQFAARIRVLLTHG